VDYAGFYINLDRSRDRRAAMEAQFAKFGLTQRYARFAAAEGNVLKLPNSSRSVGEIGCFTSHVLLLKQNIGSAHHLHVLEDDALLSRHMRPAIETAISSGMLDRFDLLFTDTFLPPFAREWARLKELYNSHVAPARETGNAGTLRLTTVEYFAATSSYLVNRNAIAKVAGVLEQALHRGPRLPLDFAIRDEWTRKTLKVGCLFPFVTAVQFDTAGSQTIDGRARDPRSMAALELARRSFFVDADIAELAARARAIALPPADAHARLLGDVLALHVLLGQDR
jgi:GR25 family glycosyltransferase involved in LPS biosynthesis